jgi:hypothetical protein
MFNIYGALISLAFWSYGFVWLVHALLSAVPH